MNAQAVAESPARPLTGKRSGNARARKRWARRALTIAAALIAVIGIAIAWMPKPIPIEAAAVRRGPMRATVDEDGRTRVKDRYVVSAPVLGNVARIELRPGDPVKKGDVLARILPAEPPLLDARTRAAAEAKVAAAIAAQQQARAAIARADTAADHAARDVQQLGALAKNGSVSSDTFEHAQFEARLRGEELASARFAAEVADHDVEMARVALQRLGARSAAPFDVPSPTSGRVLRVAQQSAAVVQAGAPLVEVGDPEALEIVVDVLTTDAVEVRPDAHATLERWGGAPLRAHVRTVEPSAFTRVSALGVEEQRVNVLLDIDAPSDDWRALGDGFRVEARIVTWESPDALAAPSSAVFRHEGGWAAFVVRDGRVARVPVETGRRSGGEVQVTRGLGEGDVVVVHPGDRVADGARVATRSLR